MVVLQELPQETRENVWQLFMEEGTKAPHTGPYPSEFTADALNHAYKTLDLAQHNGQVIPSYLVDQETITQHASRALETIALQLGQDGADKTALETQRNAITAARDYLLGTDGKAGANIQAHEKLQAHTTSLFSRMETLFKDVMESEHDAGWRQVEETIGGITKKSLEMPFFVIPNQQRNEFLYDTRIMFGHPDFSVRVMQRDGVPVLNISHKSGQMPLTGAQLMRAFDNGTSSINELWKQVGGPELAQATSTTDKFAQIDKVKLEETLWKNMLVTADNAMTGNPLLPGLTTNLSDIKDAYRTLGLRQWSDTATIEQAVVRLKAADDADHALIDRARNTLLSEATIAGQRPITINQHVRQLLDEKATFLSETLSNRFAHGFTHWNASDPESLYAYTHGTPDYSTYHRKPCFTFSVGHMSDDARREFGDIIQSQFGPHGFNISTYKDFSGLEMLRVEAPHIGKTFSLDGAAVTAEELARAVPHMLQHTGTTLSAAVASIKSAKAALGTAEKDIAFTAEQQARLAAAHQRSTEKLVEDAARSGAWDSLINGSRIPNMPADSTSRTFDSIYYHSEGQQASTSMVDIQHAYKDLGLDLSKPATTQDIEAKLAELLKDVSPATADARSKAQAARDLLLKPVQTGEPSALTNSTLHDCVLAAHEKAATELGETARAAAAAAVTQVHTPYVAPYSGGGSYYAPSSGASSADTATTAAKDVEKGGKMGMVALGVGAAVVAGWAILERMKRQEKSQNAEAAQAKS